MTNEVTPEPLENEVKADIIMELATKFNLTLPNAAGVLEFFLDKGWNPPVLTEFDIDFNHVALPYPTAYALRTPEEEIDIMDRIISGLPARVLTPANPDGVHIYDVASLHPKEVNLWKRIPEFENYEANPFGVVRNRWTRRVLDVARIGDQESVEMHDKDGFPHELNIRYIVEKTFDN